MDSVTQSLFPTRNRCSNTDAPDGVGSLPRAGERRGESARKHPSESFQRSGVSERDLQNEFYII